MRDGVVQGQTGLDRATRIKLARFVVRALVGAAGTAGHYAFLIAAVSIGVLGPVPATVLGALLGSAIHSVLDARVCSRGLPGLAAARRFAATAALAASANGVLMAVLLAVFPLDYLAAQLLVTAMLSCATFGIHPAWTSRATKAR